jgi:hypothetical protein
MQLDRLILSYIGMPPMKINDHPAEFRRFVHRPHCKYSMRLPLPPVTPEITGNTRMSAQTIRFYALYIALVTLSPVAIRARTPDIQASRPLTPPKCEGLLIMCSSVFHGLHIPLAIHAT